MPPSGHQRRQSGPSVGGPGRLMDVPSRGGHQGTGTDQTLPWTPALLWRSCRQGARPEGLEAWAEFIYSLHIFFSQEKTEVQRDSVICLGSGSRVVASLGTESFQIFPAYLSTLKSLQKRGGQQSWGGEAGALLEQREQWEVKESSH